MKKSKIFLSLIFLVVLVWSCSKSDETATPEPIPEDTFIRAADISFIPLIESEGTVYKNNGVAQNPLTTLKNAGCNTIRIRLWKTPTVNQSTFNEVKALPVRVLMTPSRCHW